MDDLMCLDFASVTEADGVLIVGFADHEFETTRYIMLQRSLDPSDDDGVYLERDGQQFGGYGDIKTCTLTRQQLELALDPCLAEAVELPRQLAIRFSCDEAVFQMLRAALPRIFSGTSCTVYV